MIKKILDFCDFPVIDNDNSHNRGWKLNFSVFFCLIITAIITIWFWMFNKSLAAGNGIGLSAGEWIGVTALMYGFSLIPLAIILIVERLAFKVNNIPSLGLKYFKGAIKNKVLLISAIFLINLLILCLRWHLYKDGQLSISGFLREIPVTFIVAVCEELIFRGYIQNIMTRRFGDFYGIVFTAMLFTVVHLPVRILIQSTGILQTIFSVLITFIGSLALGYFARKDRCIHGCVILHYAINLSHYISLL